MTREYLRECRLVLGNNGEEIDLSQMHVDFDIRQATRSSPNSAVVRVYNLSKDTQRRAQKEFDYIDLSVGYDGELSRLFYGQIRQFNGGRRQDAKTSFIDFICQDGDYAHNWTVINRTLAAGWTQRDQYEELKKAMLANGLDEGHTGFIPEVKFPRARVMYGAARDYLNNLATNINADWSIQNNRLTLIPYDSTLPDEAVVLNALTGLIGLPQQTLDGITVRCLINPKIQVGGLIQLDNASIQTANIDISYQAVNYIPDFDADGIYKVLAIYHRGDTRGNPWYSDLVCVGIRANAPTRKAGPFYNATFNHGVSNDFSRDLKTK